ncbi:MAG: MerR family transcriptional regulator [Clostridia bacterium]|nr:MerR family transcriptional regulator [Clostridia bacterium]
MKMKKACEATFLTERAIRLYISKGLITPRQVNGLIDFSPEDIILLQDIALFRQMDFSMEQIAGLISGAAIPSILAERREAALAGAERENTVAAALGSIIPAEMTDLHTLADGVRARSVAPMPDFTQFDEISDEVRHREACAASREVDRQQKWQRVWHHLGWTAFAIAVVAVMAAVFLAQTRVEGYIPVSPITVVEVQGERATFRTGNEQAITVLGRDSITVPYRVDGFNTDTRDKWGRPAIAAGETIDHACLLKVRLTNGDLLRLGISPLQDFDPPSVQRHNEWMTLILRAALGDGRSDDCLLMLREYPGTTPLLWVEE